MGKETLQAKPSNVRPVFGAGEPITKETTKNLLEHISTITVMIKYTFIQQYNDK